MDRLVEREKIDLHLVDASDRFLAELKGVTEPEKKRKTIGKIFIDIFQEQADEIKKSLPDGESIDFLLQGTLYPDVIESVSYKGRQPSEECLTLFYKARGTLFCCKAMKCTMYVQVHARRKISCLGPLVILYSRSSSFEKGFIGTALFKFILYYFDCKNRTLQ